jgi:hypothetical protein
MAELKIKLEVNRGRKGVPLKRLIRIADEARKFLEMFAKDTQLGEGEWIAERFTNGSVGYDNTFFGETTRKSLVQAQKALAHITDPKRTSDDLGYGLSRETFFQYGKIAESLPIDDVMSIGLYNGHDEPEWRELSRRRFLEIEQEITERATHYGGVKGVITAFFKSFNTVWIHELSTRARVICKFQPSEYEKIWKLLESKDAIVNVEGWITHLPSQERHLTIETISPVVQYIEGDLEKFFGIDPDFTGAMSTGEYIDGLRGETVDEYLET